MPLTCLNKKLLVCLKKLSILILLGLGTCLPSVASAQAGNLGLGASSSGTDTVIVYSSLEEALKNPQNVYRLDIRRKKLTEFPKEIFVFANLQELNLSRNKIYKLPPEIRVLTNLHVLDISKNKLETIPPEIGKLRQLTQLILSENHIYSLPPEIGDLENLQLLDMWGNDIIEFPQELSGLSNLKVLDLRVIQMNKNRQNAIKELLPHTKIYFSASCNCD